MTGIVTERDFLTHLPELINNLVAGKCLEEVTLITLNIAHVIFILIITLITMILGLGNTSARDNDSNAYDGL